MPESRLQRTRDAYREPRLSMRIVREYNISTDKSPAPLKALVPIELLEEFPWSTQAAIDASRVASDASGQ